MIRRQELPDVSQRPDLDLDLEFFAQFTMQTGFERFLVPLSAARKQIPGPLCIAILDGKQRPTFDDERARRCSDDSGCAHAASKIPLSSSTSVQSS